MNSFVYIQEMNLEKQIAHFNMKAIIIINIG